MRSRLKVVALVAAVCVVWAAGWVAWGRFFNRRVTDRDVLRESVTALKCAGAGDRPELHRQIFEQQAGQGYYDDAWATGHLLPWPDGARLSIVELARVRTENGDLAGAKTMMKQFAGSDFGREIARAIAVAQVSRDLTSALELATDDEEREAVLFTYAQHQIKIGNLAGALETAAKLKSPDPVFEMLVPELGWQENRVHELASKMSDRKLARQFERVARFHPAQSAVMEFKEPSQCDVANRYADQGRFAEADAVVEQNNCTDAFVAIKQYEVDPVGAERLLRAHADQFDLLFALDKLAVSAARKRNTSEALRFLGELHSLEESASRSDGGPMVRTNEAENGIARYWTEKDGANAVLKWARFRDTCEERSWALLGIAQALGHSRTDQATGH